MYLWSSARRRCVSVVLKNLHCVVTPTPLSVLRFDSSSKTPKVLDNLYEVCFYNNWYGSVFDDILLLRLPAMIRIINCFDACYLV